MGKTEKSRVTYSVRLDPELIRLLKHVAIDESRSVGELLEEGIAAVLSKRKTAIRTSPGQRHTGHKYDGLEVDDDQFDIPGFLRESAD